MVGMSLTWSSFSSVGEVSGEVADMNENQSGMGLETNIRKLMLFSEPQEIGFYVGKLQVLIGICFQKITQAVLQRMTCREQE